MWKPVRISAALMATWPERTKSVRPISIRIVFQSEGARHHLPKGRVWLYRGCFLCSTIPLLRRTRKSLSGSATLLRFSSRSGGSAALLLFMDRWQRSTGETEHRSVYRRNFWRLVTSRAAPGSLRPGRHPLRSASHGTEFRTPPWREYVPRLLAAGHPLPAGFLRCVLFLEDVDEEPYRIDRMLVQLRNASILRHSSAILIGGFTHCSPRTPSAPFLDIARRSCGNLSSPPEGLPLAGVPFGHIREKSDRLP